MKNTGQYYIFFLIAISTKHASLRSKSKDWLILYKDNAFEVTRHFYPQTVVSVDSMKDPAIFFFFFFFFLYCGVKHESHDVCSIRGMSCLSIARTWVHLRFLGGVHVVHLISFLCCVVLCFCVLFVFVFCLFLCFVCFRPVTCVPNIRSVSGLSIFDNSLVFLRETVPSLESERSCVIEVSSLLLHFVPTVWLIGWFLVYNATFSNISPISWRPVLVVEEAGVPEENHWPWASNW